MIFNLPPKELDTTMHSPGECIKQAISTDIRSRRATSDVRGSSTTSLPPAFCKLAIRPNSFDVRRVKLLLQTLPDVYYGCLNGKFFCVPYSLISTIAIIRGEACDADINNRVPSFDRVASVEIYTLHPTKDDRSSKSVSFVRCRRLILSGRGKKSMQLFCSCSLQRK